MLRAQERAGGVATRANSMQRSPETFVNRLTGSDLFHLMNFADSRLPLPTNRKNIRALRDHLLMISGSDRTRRFGISA